MGQGERQCVTRDDPGTTFTLSRADSFGTLFIMPCDPVSVRF